MSAFRNVTKSVSAFCNTFEALRKVTYLKRQRTLYKHRIHVFKVNRYTKNRSSKRLSMNSDLSHWRVGHSTHYTHTAITHRHLRHRPSSDAHEDLPFRTSSPIARCTRAFSGCAEQSTPGTGLFRVGAMCQRSSQEPTALCHTLCHPVNLEI